MTAVAHGNATDVSIEASSDAGCNILEHHSRDFISAKQESARLDNQKQQLLEEIEANKTKLASAQRNLEQLQSQASQLEANLQDTVASQQQQQQITAQINGLEREIATLERTIDDLLADFGTPMPRKAAPPPELAPEDSVGPAGGSGRQIN